MLEYFNNNKNKNSVLVGDLNIAPHEHDVWSLKQAIKRCFNTPMETELLIKFINDSKWVDVGRKFSQKMKNYIHGGHIEIEIEKSNRGRRLDHILVSKDLETSLKSYQSCKDIRDWEKPSDHVPLVVELRIWKTLNLSKCGLGNDFVIIDKSEMSLKLTKKKY